MCFDFETTSLDKEQCEVWQIGAVALRPRDLQIFDTHFKIMMKILEPEKVDPESLAISRMTLEQIEDEGIEPGVAWHAFADWVAQFNLGGKTDLWNAPVAAGHNIVNYDLPIYERYCRRYKTMKKDKKLGKEVPGIFNGFKHYDLLQIMNTWTENLKEPKSLSLVNLREYMGMPRSSIENAHDALQDVQDTAAILSRVLRLHRTMAPRVQFKNCFNPEAAAADKAAKKLGAEG